MSPISSARLVRVWSALVGLTLLSVDVFRALNMNGPSRLLVALILVVAAFKGWLIGWEYMNLRQAPRLLQGAFGAWILVMTLGLIGLYVQPLQ
jgi:hypothetical protein